MRHGFGAVSITDFLDLSKSYTAITDVRFLLAVTAVQQPLCYFLTAVMAVHDRACLEFHPLQS